MELSPAFEKFYSEMYVARWKTLLYALLREETQVQRVNLFSEEKIEWNGEGEIPRSKNGTLAYYVMDPASILAARALKVQAGDRVLDMCAAPGGKTLVLAEAHPAELLANEISNDRRARLTKVIQQYIPREKRDNIFVTGKEGGKFALTHKEYFDRILVDAPCSGERHLLHNQKEMKDWSVSRTKKLAQRQYALMTSALLACKSGGRIVYSTCSISNLENDGVIEELIRRKGDSFEVLNSDDLEFSHQNQFHTGEKTKYGRIHLPDLGGIGPIFYSVLKKN